MAKISANLPIIPAKPKSRFMVFLSEANSSQNEWNTSFACGSQDKESFKITDTPLLEQNFVLRFALE